MLLSEDCCLLERTIETCIDTNIVIIKKADLNGQLFVFFEFYYQAAIYCNNLTIQYISIEDIDRDSLEWDELKEKLSMKSTQTITSDDGKEEEVTDTYGYFVHRYGFTPTIIIIKDGKQTGGLIGGADKEELLNWIKEKVN